jgi:hypothetical protein
MRGVIRAVFVGVFLVAIAIGGWVLYLYESPHAPASAPAASAASTLSPEETSAIAVVIAFGKSEQLVSVLAPDASTTIASVYGAYVTPSLLSSWEASPQSAPGRTTSSPWPDHITISSVNVTATGVEVDGTLVMMTSNSLEHGGNDGTDPIIVDLVYQSGQWLISSYQDLAQD